MSIKKIVIAPDPVLKRKADPIPVMDEGARQLLRDLEETMLDAPSGIGLAAPQIGVSRRAIVVDMACTDKENEAQVPLALANPEIIQREGEIVWDEGCLSLPDFTGEVVRSEAIKVRGLNQAGEEVTVDAEGLLAVCFQHEIDHLDGLLFVDHISRLKREIILKKLKKLKKDGEL